MQNKTTNHRVYAGFGVRLAAFLLDMIIVNIVLMVVRIPKWIMEFATPDNFLVRDFIFQYSLYDIFVYFLTVLYFILLTYFTGATLGKKIFQIRVVSTQERKMTLFEVVYRETIGRFLSSVVMHVGYILILLEKEHRGIHDLLSDTCVVYYHETKVYTHADVNYRNMTTPMNPTTPMDPTMGQPYQSTGNTGDMMENPYTQAPLQQETPAQESQETGQESQETRSESQENRQESRETQQESQSPESQAARTTQTSPQPEEPIKSKMDASYFNENE